jgi:hypothetical protein
MPAMSESNTPADNAAHDVLAAEAFAVPARDPSLTHGPVVLPEDPSGIAEPHDILAAEEFAMPAGAPAGEKGGALARHAGSAWRAALGIALVILIVLQGRRRRSASRARHAPGIQ